MLVSRRRFVANVLAIPAAAAFFPWRLWGVSGSSGLYDTKLFPKPDVIRYDSECYTIRGVDTFIFSLECPYSRCAPESLQGRHPQAKILND